MPDRFDIGEFFRTGFTPITPEQRRINQMKEDARTVNIFGNKVSETQFSGLLALGALSAAGIAGAYVGTRGIRVTRPAAGPRAFRSGARPMTTPERSVAVTRSGRNGVGNIGSSIRPQDPYIGEQWDGNFAEPFSSYEEAHFRAAKILESRGKTDPSKLIPVSGPLVNTRYAGHTETVNVPDFPDEPFITYTGRRNGVDYDMITGAMKKTLDWKAARAPLRRTAAVKRRAIR
jgi:hypothetical protein